MDYPLFQTLGFGFLCCPTSCIHAVLSPVGRRRIATTSMDFAGTESGRLSIWGKAYRKDGAKVFRCC